MQQLHFKSSGIPSFSHLIIIWFNSNLESLNFLNLFQTKSQKYLPTNSIITSSPSFMLERSFSDIFIPSTLSNPSPISLFCVTVLSLLLYGVLLIADFALFLWILSFFIMRMFGSYVKVKSQGWGILFFAVEMWAFEFFIQLFLFSSFDDSFAFSLFHFLK